MEITFTVSVARVAIRDDSMATCRIVAYGDRGERLIHCTLPRSLAEMIAERLSVTIGPATRDESHEE
jgi:hypothetical protein